MFGKLFSTVRLGLVFLLSLVAALSSGMLVWRHFSGLALPGCGPTSACAQLATSQWGNVLGWPVSFIGFAYFCGLSVAVMTLGKKGVPRLGAIVVYLGGLSSLGFLSLMALEQKWCAYCLIVHVANLSIVATLVGAESESHGRKWLTTLAASAGVVSILLGIAQWQTRSRVAQQQRAETLASVDEVLAQSTGDESSGNSEQPPQDGGFAGRYRRGPEEASIRLVVFHDYQCGDCAELDEELGTLMEQYPSLSVTVGHYPLCSQCNPTIPWDFFHQQACQAAYIAEAANQLGGEEAFWKAHRWLFEHEGQVDDEVLSNLATELQMDLNELKGAAESEAAKAAVHADITFANALGATGTPFVFLNGVEIRGTASEPGNVRLAIEKVMADPPPPRTADWDRRPPGAEQRLLTEWMAEEPTEKLPPKASARYVFGNVSAEKRVLLFLEPSDRDAADLFSNALQVAKQRNNVRLEAYLYPIDRKLNPKFANKSRDYFPMSESLCRLIEALNALVQDRQLEVLSYVLNQSDSSSAVLDASAKKFGLDPDSILAALGESDIPEGISQDLEAAAVAGVGWAPTLIVHGRSAPTSRLSPSLIETMLESEPDAKP